MKTDSVFDILGPIMVGPSSSHTAGAVRLGLLAGKILGVPVKEAHILLHGSFAETGKGHGTDLALTAGLLGMGTDDQRIKRSLQIAKEKGISIRFEKHDLGDVHPNSVRFLLQGAQGEQADISGCSLGGGKIVINNINGFDMECRGEYPTLLLLYTDFPGMITEITRVLAEAGINIAQMRVSREGKGKRALAVIETDEGIEPDVARRIQEIDKIQQVLFIDSLEQR